MPNVLLLLSESQHKGAMSLFPLWGKDEARPLIRVSAVCFLQWFDTDSWVTGRTLILCGSPPGQMVEEDSSQNQLTQVHLQKWSLSRSSSSRGCSKSRQNSLMQIVVLRSVSVSKLWLILTKYWQEGLRVVFVFFVIFSLSVHVCIYTLCSNWRDAKVQICLKGT